MRHIDEQTLERFLLDAPGMESSLRSDIQEHLGACTTCAQTLEFLRTFHEDLSAAGKVTARGMDNLMHTLFPSGFVIPLHPFHHIPGPRQHDDRYTTVLAAMTGEQSSGRFHTVATLASESQGTVVRMLYDRAEESFKLYVHSDDPRKREYAIISMPEIGADFVTDRKGQVAFKLADPALHLSASSLTGVMLTVVASCTFAAGDFHRGTSPEEHTVTRIEAENSITLVYRDGLLKVFVESPTDHLPISRVLVQPSEDRALLVGLTDGKGSCELEELPAHLTIRLYY